MICPSEKASNTILQVIRIKKPILDVAAAVCWCNPQLPPTLLIPRQVLMHPVMCKMNVGII